MKKNLLLIATLFLFVNNVHSQVTKDVNNSATSNADYVGWDNATTDPVRIKHENNRDIEFYTNTGAATFGTPKMMLDRSGSLGIGTGTATPSSWLHVAPPGSNESFRTSSSATNIGDMWKMFRGTDEMLRMWFATTANALNLRASRGALRLASGTTGGGTNEGIEIAGGTGADAGYVGIGNYTAFGAANLLHVHEATAATDAGLQLSNASTCSVATDGFLIDVTANTPIVNIRQQELQPMRFWGMDIL